MFTTTKSTTALLTLAGLLSGASYPPAQGPPPPSGSGIQEFPTAFFQGEIQANIQRMLNDLNARLAGRTDVHAKVTFSSVQAGPPMPIPTQYQDRPNQRYIWVPHIVTLKVSDIEAKAGGFWIPYPFDRKIYVSVNVNTFCNGWETGLGTIQFVSESDPPYLDSDPSILESAVNEFLGGWLVEYVNANIRQNLPGGEHGTSPPPAISGKDWSCNSLGSLVSDLNWIQWARIASPPRGPQSMDVQLTKVKRLAAHRLNGGVLYQTVESPLIDFWAGSGHRYYQLPPMVEGQEVVPAGSPISISIPANNTSLVVIASTQTDFKDSGYQVYSSAASFGNGTQKLTVDKAYWLPPDPFITKPQRVFVPGYELTFQVFVPGAAPINVPPAPQPLPIVVR